MIVVVVNIVRELDESGEGHKWISAAEGGVVAV